MSEMSSLFTEYERVSKLFRYLNDAILFLRQAELGIKVTPDLNEETLTANFEKALAELSAQATDVSSPILLDRLSDEDVDISSSTLMTIGRRAHHGLNSLTEQDLGVIEKVTGLLDSRSEMLFRRIQK